MVGCETDGALRRNLNPAPAAATTMTATMAMGTSLLPPSFFCSPETASKVPKLARATDSDFGSDLESGLGSIFGSARFSSFLGNGTGGATSAAGTGLIGSTLGAGTLLARAGAAAAAADDVDGLITTGAGAGGTAATGLGMATGGSG